MAAADLISELSALGLSPRVRDDGFTEFDYEVEVGPLSGQSVKLALMAPPDWPLSPPSGPHVSPRILPINTEAGLGHPLGGVHEAAHLGPDWEYWSRPAAHWSRTTRDADAYMAHIRRLFDTLPHDLA